MNIPKLAISRPVTTGMAIMVIILVGCLSIIGIPMDLMPSFDLPVAIAYVQYPNAAPEEIESLVTEPLEQALASVEHLDSITSMTTEGTSMVMVTFASDTDMNFATLDMREKVSLISGYLPDDATEPMIIKMGLDMAPVMQIYIASDSMDLTALNQIVEDDLTSYFERADGVASVSSYGGTSKELSIEFDQEKLSGYGLSLAQVSGTLASENLNLPSGEIAKGETKLIARAIGEFDSVNDVLLLPITLHDGSIVRLQDIATIEEKYPEQTSISRVDGNNAVAVVVSKQSDANTVETCTSIQETIKSLESKYPELNFTVGFDQSDYIKNSISNVAQSAVAGAVLAALVIFLFLSSISSTLVIAISIPTAFFATFCLMNLANMTLNMVTLSALTLTVGMLVDNSVVVTENIYRLSKEEKLSPFDSALKGSKQVVLAIAASTLTSVVVFLPMALSGGMASMLLSDFCWTFIIALAASLLIAITAVPMLSSRLLNSGASDEYLRIGRRRYKYRILPKFSRMITKLGEGYSRLITSALRHRKRIVALCLVIFIVSAALLGITGMEFFPASDEGMFQISVDMPYGTSLNEKDRVMSEIEAIVMEIPELKHCTVDIGASMMGMMSGGSSSVSVVLTSKEERSRSLDEIMDEVEQACGDISGAELTFTETSSMSMGSSTDLSLTISGAELDELRNLGLALTEEIAALPGVAEATNDIEDGNPEVQLVLDRSIAAFYGITTTQLASSLSTALSGTSTTDITIDGKNIDVKLSLADDYSDAVGNLEQIQISTPAGGTVPVGQIADIQFDNSPVQINRLNQERYITINVDIASDDLSKTSAEIMEFLDSYPFPEGYGYEDGGMYEQMTDTFGDLLLALLAAVLLVFMVMAAQFESFVLSLIVMASIPFAMSGAFLALFLTGSTLSITSFAGLIILVGIVVNNAILLVEFIKINKENGMDRNLAIISAGRHRLRPILMTTTTTIVGMIPLSLGLGDGGEIMAPLAISVMGGLMGSTLVALILIPVLYSLVDDARERKRTRKEQHHAEILALEEEWKEEDEHGGKTGTH